MVQPYKTLDKTEHKGGFSVGYIKEEFLNHCTYTLESGNIIFTPIENKPYKFGAYDFTVGYRLTFDKLNYISFNELKFLESDIIELTFYYTCDEKEKYTTLNIDNDRLLDFTFSTMY